MRQALLFLAFWYLLSRAVRGKRKEGRSEGGKEGQSKMGCYSSKCLFSFFGVTFLVIPLFPAAAAAAAVVVASFFPIYMYTSFSFYHRNSVCLFPLCCCCSPVFRVELSQEY